METGSKQELCYVVQVSDLAKSLSFDAQDQFPEVLATARMIALMEVTASRLMKPLLAEGELSVGVNVNVNHLAATPVGEQLRITAVYQGMKGKLYQFDVELYDGGGLAGSGSHTRAIVKTERLLQGAQSRVKT